MKPSTFIQRLATGSAVLVLSVVAVAAMAGPKKESPERDTPYVIVVSAGDATVEKLFARYPELAGTSWEELASHNLLRPGARVVVPSEMLRDHGKVLAKIRSPYGEVEVKRSFDKHFMPVVEDLLLREGDELRTWRRAGVRVVFEDGNQIVVRSQSKARLVSLSSEPANAHRRIELEAGSIFSEIERKLHGRFEVATPTATTIIRGTRFRVKVEPNDATRVEVLRGAVSVESGDEATPVGAQQGSLTSRAGAASRFPLPGVPSDLISPLAKQVFRGERFEHSFRWAPVDGAMGYHLEIARDESFHELALERWIAGNPGVFVTDLEPGTYFWRASATSPEGFEGDSSESSYFVVVRPN